MSHKKVRIDKLLMDKGLVHSREKAKALILEGNVLVEGNVVDKAGSLVNADVKLTLKKHPRYVSRGGVKLEHAIKEFQVELTGKIAMDAGCSTGGFTDCLLQHGAEKVYAVDVGYGQLDWKLRRDGRVVPLEKTNIRYLEKAMITEGIDIATVDLSFISLLKVLPKISEFLKPAGKAIALIKPQFEANRKDIDKGGVVKDEGTRMNIIERIKTEVEAMGFTVQGVTQSPILGPKGNVEYFICLRRSS